MINWIHKPLMNWNVMDAGILFVAILLGVWLFDKVKKRG